MNDVSHMDLDTILVALSHSCRRTLLSHMHAAGRDVFSLEELTDAVIDADETPTTAGGDDRERVKIQLHHRHLPKMDQAGLLDYDARTGDVRHRGPINIGDIAVANLTVMPCQ